ncbi:unnamed protein product [Notodromas monacha]|uniref:Uncharacterized protein n=1 Tax=Notodromas monacha TaxID=399045 RepID=A0A7R9C3I4_9CRUS|nr:unnamed protein product [Notodromas monacha]CAG0925628.1 unnamed protein product [Notodromas monacha]
MNSLRMEVSSNGIHVTVICPGAVTTNFVSNSWKALEGIQWLTRDDYSTFLNPLTPERCAKLTSVAVVNKMSEAWISTHPLLIGTRFFVAFPTIAQW